MLAQISLLRRLSLGCTLKPSPMVLISTASASTFEVLLSSGMQVRVSICKCTLLGLSSLGSRDPRYRNNEWLNPFSKRKWLFDNLERSMSIKKCFDLLDHKTGWLKLGKANTDRDQRGRRSPTFRVSNDLIV